MKRILFKVVLLLIGLYPIITLAFDSSSYIPRVYLESMMGDELLGQGDLIVPFSLSNDRSIFLYGQGRMSTPENGDVLDHAPWTGSLGIGSRKIYGNHLLGAYIFGDYGETTGGFNYWNVSPGVEALGKVWDFRANGYFPVGKHSWSKEDWADKFSIYDYVKYTGHKEYDRWANMNQEIASGGDVEIGRKLFKQKNTLVKAYLGGYYFDMKENKDIIGARARITFQPSQFITFSINDTYDRQYHNTLMFGMRVRLNDLVNRHPQYKVTEDKNLSVRLLDPVERNIGSIGYATSIPVSKEIKLGDWGLEHDNIWFFKPGSTKKGHSQNDGDGTYEHPFDGFDGTNVDTVEADYEHIGAIIDKYPLLYFAPGTYDLSVFENNYRFLLPEGWGMYGRTEDYFEPAQGDERALFIGGLDLYRGNNVLDSIRLENDGSQTVAGIRIWGNVDTISDIYMNNISVGALSNDGGYKIGIDIEGATGVTLNESQVYGYDDSEGGTSVYGIKLYNSELTLGDGNSISAEAKDVRDYGYALGINASCSTLDINGSGNSISATTASGGYDSAAWGIYAINSTVDISGNGNSISATATGGDSREAYGIYASRSIINFDPDSYTEISVGGTETGGDTSAWGIKADSSSELEIGGSREEDLEKFEELNLITFERQGTGTGGNKIEWGSRVLPWITSR